MGKDCIDRLMDKRLEELNQNKYTYDDYLDGKVVVCKTRLSYSGNYLWDYWWYEGSEGKFIGGSTVILTDFSLPIILIKSWGEFMRNRGKINWLPKYGEKVIAKVFGTSFEVYYITTLGYSINGENRYVTSNKPLLPGTITTDATIEYWSNIEQCGKTELTMQEIADKFEIPVEKLKIKK
jgi:hypothetical protein